MRVFYPLLCYYPSQNGGPANTLYWLHNELGSNGFECVVTATVFKLPHDFKFNNYLYNSNNEIEFVSKGIIHFVNKGAFNKIYYSNIVHFSSLFFPPTLPLSIYCLIRQKKIVISPRGELYAPALKIKSWKKKIWIFMFRIFQKKLNFHATNNEERDIIQEIFPKARRIDIIPNYISLPEKLDLPIIKQILFLGRINPIKNIDVLIKSFACVVKNVNQKDLKLIIAGTAELSYEKRYKKELDALVVELKLSDQIFFVGEITGNNKQCLLASSIALILPSKSENFGNVVIESLSQGTPVIASKNTPWEILESSNAGYWVEGSEQGLKLGIEKVLNMPSSKYQLMRKNAYSFCKENFDVKTKIGVWLEYYNEI